MLTQAKALLRLLGAMNLTSTFAEAARRVFDGLTIEKFIDKHQACSPTLPMI